MTKQEFVKQAYEAAKVSSSKSGMPAMVTVAQAALESNWGQSKLSAEAFNYFGIKAHGKHEQVEMSTTECVKGATLAVKAKFAKYASMLECFECRDGMISRGAVYAETRRNAGDELAFIRELAKHWATDPKYATKLDAMLKQVKAMV